MARSQAKPSTQGTRQQARGKRPQGIEKRPQPLRRSARLQRAQQNNEQKYRLPSPPTTNPPGLKPLHRSPPLETITPSSSLNRPEAHRRPEPKPKQSQEAEASHGPSEKRPRAHINSNRSSHRVETWLEKGSYPEDYFESGDKTWEDIIADTSVTRPRANTMDGLSRPLLAKRKSAASLVSLRRQALEANMIAPTETTEDKSLPYRSPGYEEELKMKGSSHLYELPEGITEESELGCRSLLTTTQAVPQQSLFGDSQFGQTCNKLRNRNEARVVEDASPLIAPSPETLNTFGAVELEHLIFNANERWGESIPITKTCPQPARCVGFGRSAFTIGQLQKLTPYTGSLIPVEYYSPFLATWRMYFPFFTCEAKSGLGDLDIADKQNAHSMTIAVRGIVELFKAVNREKELHRKILAFSVSHDATTVRIYGHYAIIEDCAARFYRHSIHSFDFTAQNGKDRWTAYQFTTNVYFEFMPKLHRLICSAIDQMPVNTAFQGSDPPSLTPLSHSFGTDLESEQPNSQEMAASVSASQNTAGSKKRKITKDMLEKENERYRGQVNQLLGQVNLLKQQSSLNETPQNDSDFVTMLRQELERQRQELERQRLENERQRQEAKEQLERQERQRLEMKEENEGLKTQISKLTETVMQSLSAQPKP